MREGDVVVCRPVSSLSERLSRWVVVDMRGCRFTGWNDTAIMTANRDDFQVVRYCSAEEHKQFVAVITRMKEDGFCLCHHNKDLLVVVKNLLAQSIEKARIVGIEIVPKGDLWQAKARVKRNELSGQVTWEDYESVGSTPEAAFDRLQRVIDFQGGGREEALA